MEKVALTVVYDNYVLEDRLRAAHGFACIACAAGRTVLFDTGGSGRILLQNMNQLGVDPAGIEAVVLSHMHWDHIGGLDAVLGASPGVAVFAPCAFSSTFLDDLRTRAGTVVETASPREVVPHICTTEMIEGPIVEQALCIETADGAVVVTGCAHAGVVELAASARRMVGRLHTVLGGFHMKAHGADGIERTIAGLRELAVKGVGPCHCSGEPARAAMRQAWGEGYVDTGVGARMSFALGQEL